ncbi:MAG: GNAT family N-acetyltransferase [Clostridia bacterium]|nr:GNAT family N-acetyltransferase [Clostridia bacterium]
MKLSIKYFNEFNINELYDILRARSEVFVVEQKCIYQDLDDLDNISYHVVLRDDDDTLVAYIRLYKMSELKNTVKIGRVLTTKRGKGYGGQTLTQAIEFVKTMPDINDIYIEAQTHAVGFYMKKGFEVISEEFLEDGIPHKKMCLHLK